MRHAITSSEDQKLCISFVFALTQFGVYFEVVFGIVSGMSLGVPVHVFGTETHMTAIVGMALGKSEIPNQEAFDSNDAASMFFMAAEVFHI